MIEDVDNANDEDVDIKISKSKKSNKEKSHLKRLDANQENIKSKKRDWKPVAVNSQYLYW